MNLGTEMTHMAVLEMRSATRSRSSLYSPLKKAYYHAGFGNFDVSVPPRT